jgi:hypothetical protein
MEGWLYDERLVDIYTWENLIRPKGVVHRMCVRLLVGGKPPTILEAEAEMFEVPHDLCRTTLQTVERIVGLSIASGYTAKVHELLGGTQSCTHLAHLVAAMGPAATHGYWTNRSQRRKPSPHKADRSERLTALIDSCKIWKRDGPLVQKK